MKVLLIRHAAAAGRDVFDGSDFLRPLTDDGRRKARAVFRALAKVYDVPEVIYSSEAVRARQTAEILSVCFGGVEVAETPLLNPGSDFRRFRSLVTGAAQDKQTIALVGHEPDLSGILGGIVSDESLRVDVKKASCAEVEINRLGKGELKAFVPPRIVLR